MTLRRESRPWCAAGSRAPTSSRCSPSAFYTCHHSTCASSSTRRLSRPSCSTAPPTSNSHRKCWHKSTPRTASASRPTRAPRELVWRRDQARRKRATPRRSGCAWSMRRSSKRRPSGERCGGRCEYSSGHYHAVPVTLAGSCTRSPSTRPKTRCSKSSRGSTPRWPFTDALRTSTGCCWASNPDPTIRRRSRGRTGSSTPAEAPAPRPEHAVSVLEDGPHLSPTRS